MSDKERIAQLEAENKKLRKQVEKLKSKCYEMEDSMERVHDLVKVWTSEPCYITGNEDDKYDAEEDGYA